MISDAQFLCSRDAQKNVTLSQRLSFAICIICIPLSASFHCLAQQTHTTAQSPKADIQTFQQIENRWSQAINRRDQYALELVLSPDFLDVSEDGNMTTRDQQIAMLLQKITEPLSLDQRVVDVRTYNDLTVVIGSYVEQVRANHRLIQRNGMFSHLYVKARGTWLCVNAQRTAVVIEPALGRKADRR